MSETLEIRAELQKIARLLQLDPADLSYLDGIGPAPLAELREQIVELLFGEVGGMQRFVAPSRILPASLVASITRDTIGPVLAARIAGLVDPNQAISVVDRLPVEFLADVAVELDPRRISGIIAGLPDEKTAAITGLLAKRKEYVAMGRFMGHLSEHALAVTFGQSKDADLLQIAFVVEDKESLSTAVRLLPDKRLHSILHSAEKLDLWAEAIDLLLHLDDEQYLRMVELVSEEGVSVLDALVRTAHTEQIWSLVVPIAADMTNPVNIVSAILRADDAVMKSMVAGVVEYSTWDELYALLEKVSDKQRAELRERAAKLRLLKQLEPVDDLLN